MNKQTKELSENDQMLVDKWIKEMEDADFTYDQMIEVFKIAQEKWDALKK